MISSRQPMMSIFALKRCDTGESNRGIYKYEETDDREFREQGGACGTRIAAWWGKVYATTPSPTL